MSLEAELTHIEQQLKAQATPEGLAAVAKFVPNSQNAYGVRMPDINAIAKQYKGNQIELAVALWNKGAYEEKILAAKILERVPMSAAMEVIQIIDSFKEGIDNWAVCDALGMQGIRKPIKKHPEEVLKVAYDYLNDPNPWTIRLGLVYLVYFARNGEHLTEIAKKAEKLADHPEYYVRKAVVWVRANLDKHT